METNRVSLEGDNPEIFEKKPRMHQALIENESYDKLFENIRREIQQGLISIRQTMEWQNVMTGWRIGQHLETYLSPDQMRSVDRARFISSLARDFNRTTSYFYNMAKFYRNYPVEPEKGPLTLSHYLVLMRITDKVQRQAYQQKALREKMNWRNLQLLISEERKQAQHDALLTPLLDQQSVPQLSVTRGKLYRYMTTTHKTIRLQPGRVLVDIGFDIQREALIQGGAKVHGGEYIRSTKANETYSVHVVHQHENFLYTYKAFVERVVDADTIIVNVDCGFRTWVRRRLRLRGIDAAEMDTQRGRRAKEFVQGVLGSVDFVVIKVRELDKFGRDLADIFYLPGEKNPEVVTAKGKFLNQELLDKRMAVFARK